MIDEINVFYIHLHQYLLCQWPLKPLKCWDFYRLGFDADILTKQLKPNTAI